MSRTLGILSGLILIALGILGFFENPLVGEAGYFMTNSAHDLIHLISGIILAGVAMASPSALPGTFKTFGVIYLVLTIIGFFVVSPEGTGEIFNAVTVNNTDNWLHLALGVILFLIGYAPATEEVRTSNSEIKRPIAR